MTPNLETVGEILARDPVWPGEGVQERTLDSAPESPLISEPGAYAGIDIEDYHHNLNLLPGPSISASGMKTILNKSPFHFWADSPMNPDRQEAERADKPHFNIGKAAHDLLLLSDRWPDHYHVLPKGFKANATKKFADEIAEMNAARESGMTVLRYQDWLVVKRVSDAIGLHDLAKRALSDGVAESTLVAKDDATGVWKRARPDWLSNSVITGGDLRVVSDLKFMASTNCSPRGFQGAIWKFGYHVAAAHYFDLVEAVYGHRPTHWLHIVVEKDFPFSVSLYELPDQDVARGAHQARIAINTFADCLASGKWPAYADGIAQVGLAGFARSIIDEHGTAGTAALTQSSA